MTGSQGSTIFALSSGQPPAAIGIVRVSGPGAAGAVQSLARRLPVPRHATYASLHDPESGDLLDQALLLWFPGPGTATGEDLAEFHLHGGRAVVAGVLGALGRMPGLRPAAPGEFTRRAFDNGRIDLSEAEGLADLLAAETQSQRRAALSLAGGALGRLVAEWQTRLLRLAADLEARLDFSDEGDVEEELPTRWRAELAALSATMEARLNQPAAERLKDGIRVVVAGPVNAGKSSLVNALAERDAAIISDVPGTTRDAIEVPIAIEGVPLLITDTAGLRDSEDIVERIGIARAQARVAGADIILWLGEPQTAPEGAVIVAAKSDLWPLGEVRNGLALSSVTGEGLRELRQALVDRALALLPQEGEVALNARHRDVLASCRAHLDWAVEEGDPVLVAEELRLARSELDRITGRAGVENMLDALFGAFCIGK